MKTTEYQLIVVSTTARIGFISLKPL